MTGFVTEGGSDVSVVREICQKVGIKTQFRRMRGNSLGKGKRLADLLFAAGCKKVIILKDLHRSTASEIEQRFKEAGTTEYLGYGEQVAEEGILLAFQNLLRDESRRANMSKKGQKLVDGRGIDRILNLIWAELGGIL